MVVDLERRRLRAGRFPKASSIRPFPLVRKVRDESSWLIYSGDILAILPALADVAVDADLIVNAAAATAAAVASLLAAKALDCWAERRMTGSPTMLRRVRSTASQPAVIAEISPLIHLVAERFEDKGRPRSRGNTE